MKGIGDVGKGALKVVRKGAQALAQPLVDELKAQEMADVKNSKSGTESNAKFSAPSRKGRSTSTGYMPSNYKS